MAAAYVAGMGSPVPVPVWEAFWGIELLSRAARQAALVDWGQLEYVDVLDPDGVTLIPSVGFTDTLYWLALVVFFASPEGACLDGCGDWNPP